jgi:hypothetical protein
MRQTRSLVGIFIVVALAVGLPFIWRAGPVAAKNRRAAGTTPSCDAQRCDVQAQIDAQCGACEDANKHGEYVKCVAKTLKTAGVPKACRRAIIRCAAKSTCGRPSSVVCEHNNGQCSIEDSAAKCKHGTVSDATSCCTPCNAGSIQCCVPTSPDGAFGSEGGAFMCELLSPGDCSSAGGTNEGAGSCSPNPCPVSVTTTTTSGSTTTSIAGTTTTTMATGQIQCCVSSVSGALVGTSGAPISVAKEAPAGPTAPNCVLATPEECSSMSGANVGPGTCSPNPCVSTTTTTPGATTTTMPGATTTTTPGGTTTTTLGGGACCSAARIETLSQPGTLEVSTLPAFPFPENVHTVIEVGAADADCRHTGVVPGGGFTVPVFCIPALQFTSAVYAVGCESGGADGNAVVWDAASASPGPDIVRVGDTSDPDGNSCGTLGTGCVTTAGGAGADTRGNIDTTRGGNSNGITGKVHTAVDIPVHSITWVAADASCPDTDSTFNEGIDTPVTDFFFVLSPTSGHTSATYSDLNGDGCKRAGNGPDSKTADGSPADGPCCTVGQATTVAATGIAFTGGAPLYDITFRSITPTTISSCGAPSASETCTLTTNACQD